MDTGRKRVDVVADIAGLGISPAVHAIRGREEVSRAFRFEIDFEAPEVALDEIRGSIAQLAIAHAGGRVRHVSGVVTRLEMLASDAATEHFRYRIHLVPVPALLGFRHASSIFQDASVPEIVEKVMADAGLDAACRRFDLAGRYQKRDYCVQYDETQWEFVLRLLEEEGIWFRFDQTADGHPMVIADASPRAPRAEPSSLAFVPDAGLHGDESRAWGLVHASRRSVAKTMLDDYDFERPSLDLRASADAPDGAGPFFEYPARATAPAETTRLAKCRLEELRSTRRSIRFATDALGLQPGERVEISDHPSASGEYFVTAVDWHLRLEQETGDGRLIDGGSVETWLLVEAVPAAQPFRPARVTPRPIVAGPQTARVTGPGGEEIHCDRHGRVKLQFHWDRLGALDDKTSFWIRVAQPHTTGAVLVPRMGWEVLVDFLEDDPDRPICLGRLFNPLFPPPYDLPAHKTVTAHRSQSSPGGAGTNELRFDDAPGAQQLQLNAHHDLQITTAEKKKVRVGKEHTRGVVASNKEKVGAGEEISVTGTQTASVGGNQEISAGTRSIEVGGDCAEEVKADYRIEIGGLETIKVGNPLKALVQLAASEAIEQATALATAAAGNVTQKVMAPLRPALDAVSKATSSMPKLPGPAAGLLGKDPGGALALPPQVSQALAMADPKHVDEVVSNAITGAAAAAAPAVAAKIDQAMGGGSGTCSLTVGGNLDEQIGAVEVINAVGGIALGVGQSSQETVGAARFEMAGGGRSETTTGNKIETVGGAYVVDTGQGISLSAGENIAVTVAGAMKQQIKGGHSLSGELAAGILTRRLTLEAKESITLRCGLAEVILNSDGVSIKGTDTTIEGTITLKPAAIKPG